jgi:lipopolysaccharide/colanic/teichoic acid biosynthesis glycosyltransferase
MAAVPILGAYPYPFPRIVVANRQLVAASPGGARDLLGAAAKRLTDMIGSALLLLTLAPLFVLIAVLSKLDGPGSVFFVQRRVGHRCGTFRMYKFRSMIPDAESLSAELSEAMEGATFFKIENDTRVTALGAWLRRFSLDELPQLWNVLLGDMSLVGPRPLLLVDLDRLPRYSQGRRFSVKPGLTGLWQISGRSRLSDADRMRLDLEYVDRQSLWLDLKILFGTFSAVVSGDGAY